MQIGFPFNPYKMFVGSFIPNALMSYIGLSPGAKLCWARLAQYAGANGVAWPQQSTLAEQLGISERQTRRYIKELEDQRFIEVLAPTGKGVLQHQGNRYVFLWHEVFESANEISGYQDRLSGEDIYVLSGEDGSVLSGEDICVLSGEAGKQAPGRDLSGAKLVRRESLEENHIEENHIMPPAVLPSITAEEKEVLNILRDIANYPFDYAKDLEHIRKLSLDYPSVDLIHEAKKWATWLLDKPLKKRSNPRLQLRNWMANATKFKRERETPSRVISDAVFEEAWRMMEEAQRIGEE